MLKINYRINKLLEACHMIDSCVAREKGDKSFLDFFMKKLELKEEEIKVQYSEIYEFYLAVYDECVDLLKKYEELRPYLNIKTEDETSFITSVINHLHIIEPSLLTRKDFIYSCKSMIYDLDGTLAECDLDNEEVKIKLIAELEQEEFDFIDLFQRVNKTTLADNEKMNILNLFQKLDILLPSFIDLYRSAIKIYEKHLHLMEHYIKLTEDRLYNSDGSMVDVMDLEIGKYIELQSEEIRNAEYITSISVMNPRAIGLAFSINDRIQHQLVCGIFVYGIDDEYSRERFKESAILDQLKALGDATRLKIINLLSERPYYTKELAEATGLTPATVSHHMSILLNAKFIIFMGDGRKSTYRLNKKELIYLSSYFGELGGE